MGEGKGVTLEKERLADGDPIMSRPHSVSPLIHAKRNVGWVWGKSLQT